MKKIGRWIGIWLAILVIGIAGFLIVPRIGRQTSGKAVTSMETATLPVICTNWNGLRVNTLWGYTGPVETSYLRGLITPVNADRTLQLVLYTYGEEITRFSYALYSLDGGDYLEEKEVPVPAAGNDKTIDLRLTALMNPGTEYQLIVTLDTAHHQNVHYYTRVISEEGTAARELADFAETFSHATFDREAAREVIVPYMQPDENALNDSYAEVSLRSSFRMVTWGDLQMARSGSDGVMQITDITPTQVSLRLEYTAAGVTATEQVVTFQVKESFILRMRDERAYVLSYERKAAQPFSGTQASVREGTLWFGIIPEGSVSLMADSQEDNMVFLCQDALWSYDGTRNEMTRLFSWREAAADMRNDCPAHTMQICRVSDEGDVWFVVMGYMNRGPHEGRVGASVMRYTRETNALRELYFLPMTCSYEVMSEQFTLLSAANEDNICYVMVGNVIYALDLDGGEVQEVTGDVLTDTARQSGDVIAWEERPAGSDLADSIVLLNMKTGDINRVSAESTDFLSLEGFMGGDMVYGVGRKEEVIREAGSIRSIPYYAGRLLDTETLEQTADYQRPPYRVLYLTIGETRILLERVKLEADGSITPAPEDALILNNPEKKLGALRYSQDDELKKVWTLILPESARKELQFTSVRPSFETDADGKTAAPVTIDLPHMDPAADSRYYVYALGEVVTVTDYLPDAIQAAFDAWGAVYDARRTLYWDRDTRALSKNLVIPAASPEAGSALEAALGILAFDEGTSLPNLAGSLARGTSPGDILAAVFGSRVRVLYGCTPGQMYYWLNKDQPVLAVTGDDDALILCGYTTNTVKVCFPLTGEVQEWSSADAEAFFEAAGSRFLVIEP